jgi:hypothetical protein
MRAMGAHDFDDAVVAPRLAPGSRCYYVARRAVAGREVYRVDAAGVERVAHRRRWTPASFRWGEQHPGTDELAYALLRETSGAREPSELACRELVAHVLGRLPRDGWILPEADLELWLALHDG